MIEYNLGKLKFKLEIIKSDDETETLNTEKNTKVINYHQFGLEIIDQLDPDSFQSVINELEVGIYECEIDLTHENFKKIEHIDGEIINEPKGND